MYGVTFNALGSEIRLTIIQMLTQKEMTAGEIAAQFAICQPSVSRHLDVLKEAELVKTRKDGTRVYYSLNTEAMWAAGKFLVESVIANSIR